jgi:hypothetical protein
MKKKLLKKSLLIFGLLAILLSCNQSKKTKKNNLNDTIVQKSDSTLDTSFEKFKKRHNLTTNNFEDYKTKYKDGRKSEIRTLLTFETLMLEDTFQSYPKDNTKIALVVIEWNKSEGIVATENSAFSNLNNNQMYGGDVETNRRITPSSAKFIKLCEQFFESNVDKFAEINEIPNRDLEFVSFDFITNKGIFTGQESLKNLENNKSIFSPIFKEGKKLKLETEKACNRQ